jgi:serine/threonine protein kinase
MISHYKIIEKIGAGGMGEVWLVHDEKLNRKVALKFPSTEIYEGIESQKMLLSEAQAAAALHHPNVVTIFEVGMFEERPFLAMAYIEGPTLKESTGRRKVPIETTVRFGIQISNGLADAHEHGITHRDLKPSNIIVDKSSNLHILDFGLAVKLKVPGDNDVDKTITKHGSMGIAAGTLNYMAPEQLTGSKIGPLVDIFALGIILYELIYGDHPFKGNSSTELLRNILGDTPPQFSDKRDDVPYDLIRILRRCLQKDPEYRFQTAKDVRNELIELQELVIKGNDSSDSYIAASEKQPFLREERFALTTDSVRQLEFQSPKMIGDHIVYLE